MDDREQILLRLTRGEPIEALGNSDRESAEAWSRALDVDSEFGRFLAWIAAMAFKLPLNGEVDDPRAFDLPEIIGVMTTRSFSPFREENGGRPDDGTWPALPASRSISNTSERDTNWTPSLANLLSD